MLNIGLGQLKIFSQLAKSTPNESLFFFYLFFATNKLINYVHYYKYKIQNKYKQVTSEIYEWINEWNEMYVKMS